MGAILYLVINKNFNLLLVEHAIEYLNLVVYYVIQVLIIEDLMNKFNVLVKLDILMMEVHINVEIVVITLAKLAMELIIINAKVVNLTIIGNSRLLMNADV